MLIALLPGQVSFPQQLFNLDTTNYTNVRLKLVAALRRLEAGRFDDKEVSSRFQLYIRTLNFAITPNNNLYNLSTVTTANGLIPQHKQGCPRIPPSRNPSASIDKMSRAPNPSTGSRKISFNVSEQYDIQDVVGEGAYGVVW